MMTIVGLCLGNLKFLLRWLATSSNNFHFQSSKQMIFGVRGLDVTASEHAVAGHSMLI